MYRYWQLNLRWSSMGLVCSCSSCLLFSIVEGAIGNAADSDAYKSKWTLMFHLYLYTHHCRLVFLQDRKRKIRTSIYCMLTFVSPLTSCSLSLCANLYSFRVRFKFLFHSVLCGWNSLHYCCSSSFHFLKKQYRHTLFMSLYGLMFIFQKVTVRICTRCIALQGKL